MIVIGIVQDIGKIVDESVAEAIEQLQDHELQDEPTLTGSLFGTIRNKINEKLQVRGLKIKAYFVRGVGRCAPESKIGADVCVVFDVDTKDYKMSKGVLIQAKMDKALRAKIPSTGHPIPIFRRNAAFKKLKNQCEKMLNLSPDSFAIIYSTNNFSMVPAVSIAGVNVTNKGPIRLYGKRLSLFFKEFIMCFIGDRRITTTESLLKMYESSRDKLLITIRDNETK